MNYNWITILIFILIEEQVCNKLEVHESSSGFILNPKNISDFEMIRRYDAVGSRNCSWLIKGPENTVY